MAGSVGVRRARAPRESRFDADQVVALEHTVEIARDRVRERAGLAREMADMRGAELRRQIVHLFRRRGPLSQRVAEAMVAEDRDNDIMDKWFAFIDADGSGELDVDELETLLVGMGLSFSRADVEELLKEIDEDKSGLIDREEFHQVLNSVGDRSKGAKKWTSKRGEFRKRKKKKKREKERREAKLGKEGTGVIKVEALTEEMKAQMKAMEKECVGMKMDVLLEGVKTGDEGRATNVLRTCLDTLESGAVGDPDEMELGTLLSAYRRKIIINGLIAKYRDVEDTPGTLRLKASLDAIEDMERRRAKDDRVQEIKQERAQDRVLRRQLRDFLSHAREIDREEEERGAGILRNQDSWEQRAGIPKALPRTGTTMMRELALGDRVDRAVELAMERSKHAAHDSVDRSLGQRTNRAHTALTKMATTYMKQEQKARARRLKFVAGSELDGPQAAFRSPSTIVATGKPGLAPFHRRDALPLLGSKSKKKAEKRKARERKTHMPAFYAKSLLLRTTIGLPPQRFQVLELRERLAKMEERGQLAQPHLRPAHASFWVTDRTQKHHSPALIPKRSAFPSASGMKSQTDTATHREYRKVEESHAALDDVLEEAGLVSDSDEEDEEEEEERKKVEEKARVKGEREKKEDAEEKLLLEEMRPLIPGRRRASLAAPGTELEKHVHALLKPSALPFKSTSRQSRSSYHSTRASTRSSRSRGTPRSTTPPFHSPIRTRGRGPRLKGLGKK